MCLGSILVSSGAATNVLCATSSHFCSAEKQFRFPLELGNQRPPSSQWTVTGAGASILSSNGQGRYITHITPGKIVAPAQTQAPPFLKIGLQVITYLS